MQCRRDIDSSDLEGMVDTSDEWIVSRTGIRERRIADEDGVASYLAWQAAQAALTRRVWMAGPGFDIVIRLLPICYSLLRLYIAA